MATLNKTLRAKMARELVLRRYKDEGARLTTECVALFNTFLDRRYEGAIAKAMKAFAKVVPDDLESTNSLSLNAAGYRVTVGATTVACVRNVDSPPYFEAKAAYRPILRRDNRYGALSVEGEFADRVKAYANATEKLKADMLTAYREALAAIEQFGTAKRLAEGWPEAMPVIGHLIPENDRALPVVMVADLNTKFDLPPELAEAA